MSNNRPKTVSFAQLDLTGKPQLEEQKNPSYEQALNEKGIIDTGYYHPNAHPKVSVQNSFKNMPPIPARMFSSKASKLSAEERKELEQSNTEDTNTFKIPAPVSRK